VAEAFALANGCDLMVVGIGTTQPDAVLPASGMIEPEAIGVIERLGGVGELLGHFFDADGRPVENELTQRILTLPLDRLRNRRMVAIAGGTMKIGAIMSVLKSGLLTGLIIDEHTARTIAETAARGGTHPVAGEA
jgi:erythritol transport system ATP-binding protein